MKDIIIAEKPSIAMEYAKTFGVSTKKDGYYENDSKIITWSIGHLVTLSYPEEYDEKLKKWKMEDLPFLPDNYKYRVIDKVKKQFNIVKSLYHRDDVDTLYLAGDSGQEGLYIQSLILQQAGVRKGITVKVIWIDSYTAESIENGYESAKPYAAYNFMKSAGYMRAIEDFAMGINFSRVLSIRYGNAVNNAIKTDKYMPIAVGRVMTCVLGMVVDRERAIINFKETPFYKVHTEIPVEDTVIELEWKAVEGSKYYQSEKLYKDNGFKEEKDALQLVTDSGNGIFIKQSERKVEKRKAPMLFNLAELQSECSKKLKISPSDTLEIAQSLYEKKLTTYPRTDARVLTTAVAKEIAENVVGLKQCPGNAYDKFVNDIFNNNWDKEIENSKYVNDSKVTDHYAIIPTGQGLSAYGSLNDNEKFVYDMVIRRFLSIFYPAAEYYKLQVVGESNKEIFTASGSVLKSLGYMTVTGMSEEDEKLRATAVLNYLKEGTQYECSYKTVSGKTSPPKRYTSGDLILAMENAGQLIDDEELREQMKGSGIGTSATRAETIKKLVKNNYLSLNSKTQIVTPANAGNMIYEVVKKTIPALLNPKMTASWEKGLDGIKEGTISEADYRTKLENFVKKDVNSIKENDLSADVLKAISPYAETKKLSNDKENNKSIGMVCPICHKEIVKTKFGYGCSGYSKTGNGCKFTLPGSFAGKSLNEAIVKKLINEGRTEKISGFKSKSSGKAYSATLVLKIEESIAKISFDFN